MYDPRTQSARRVAAAERIRFTLASQATAYFIVTPLARSGIALLGDVERFVPDGHKRIAALDDQPDHLAATVIFAASEDSLRLTGYATSRPHVSASEGSVGEVSFDERTGRFDVPVFPGSTEQTEPPATTLFIAR